MIRLRALNEESSEESEGEEDLPSLTKEAQEQTAFGQYNEALSMLKENKLKEARALFEELLKNSYLVEITKPDTNDTKALNHPALVLKYSCLKNMGTLLEKQGDLKTALEYYLKATELDGGDVTLWYRIGNAATQVIDYELACDAFLEGLKCSPRHWPCLDNLITILYVLGDYISCLLYITKAFALDPDFLKGLAIRDKILEEQPSIIQDFKSYCKGYDLNQQYTDYDQDEAKEVINEALEMKEKKRIRSSHVFIPKKLETITLVQPLADKTWLALGENLVQKHVAIQEKEKVGHFCCPLDLLACVTKQDVQDEGLPQQKQCEQMEVDQPAKEETAVVEVQDDALAMQVDEEVPVDATGTVEGEDAKAKKRRRNSVSCLEQWMWVGKRRSARVRSTVKREAEREDINMEEAIKRLIPQSLLPNVKDLKRKDGDGAKSEDSMDTMDLYKLFERRENTETRSEDNQHSRAVSPIRSKATNNAMLEDDYFGTSREHEDVEEFVKQNNLRDMIDLLTNFTKALSSKWYLTWPVQLPVIYLKAYECMRHHVPHPSVFSNNNSEWLKEDAYITLLYGELLLDKWMENNETTNEDKSIFEDHIPAESIGQLLFVSAHEGIFEQEHLMYMLRLFWLKAHLFLNQGNAEIAMEALNMILVYLDERCGDKAEQVFLPNCKQHNVITKETVQKWVTTLSRNQRLYEVQQLYEEQQYEQLVEILQETFHYSHHSQMASLPANTAITAVCPDRITQLGMLMEALRKLKRYRDCFYWGEACFNEALHKYLNSEDKEQTKWASTVEKILSGLESCVNKDGLSVMDSVPANRLARLVQNLTQTMCHQLEAPDTAVEMPIESVSPWILLQQILQREDEREKTDEELQAEINSRELPRYISVLFTAHEFLGRRSWCCSNEGALLLHTMDVVIPRFKNPKLVHLRDKLNQGMEQVFYCLYAHPSKKSKARYLQDHGVPQIPLTWPRAIQLYQFYLPEELPDFDSYRVSSITADVESLLKRITSLIPAECNPAHLVDKVTAYIEEKSDSLPVLGDTHTQLPRQISSIYYLLADFYFKNNEWAKAIKHYLLDVCVNPIHVDSWAGMALARGSQLETKLNSCSKPADNTVLQCEPLKSEQEFLRQASAVRRCFQRAVDIVPTQALIWIEYGTFVYTMHSFCSRLLKQETDSLSLEMFEVLENQKDEMLDKAMKCFTTANKVWYSIGVEYGFQDERWLHHYMLGKVSEKRDEEPSVYLGHYSKASGFLYENHASYVRKINYNNPQNLAVEALEVYYRIHACILKLLEQYEGRKLDKDMKELFENLLNETANGPFMASLPKEAENKIESDEERKKRAATESIGAYGVTTKKTKFESPEDLSIIEDVIYLMEDIITKVSEIENEKQAPLENQKSSSQKEDLIPDRKPLDAQKQEARNDKEVEIMEITTANGSFPKAADAKNGEDSSAKVADERNNECILEKMEVEGQVQETVGDVITTDSLECQKKVASEEGIGEENRMDVSIGVIEEVIDDNIRLDREDEKRDDGAADVEMGSTEENDDGSEADVDEDDDDDDDNDNDDDDNGNQEGKEKISSEEKGAVKITQIAPDQIAKYAPKPLESKRSSQESMTSTSTTTTDTSTPNSSSSSSESEGDSSSSNEDSSNSSSSSDSDDSSDSESDETETTEATEQTANKKDKPLSDGNKRINAQKSKTDTKDDAKDDNTQDHYDLIKRCLQALEECVLRFPQHYKSLYRISHYYFHSKFHRDVNKCRDLLLGTYRCLLMEGRPSDASFQGLFAERKNNNFFNGVWRIPVSEIDRPGSFASHMSRCVLLLMEVLRELRDHRMLLELYLQLRKTPDPDKKYLRDSEREQLSRQALTLALQALRNKLRDGPVTNNFVLEVYRIYQRVQRHIPHKEAVFSSLLVDAYKQYTKAESVVLDQALRFCQQQIAANRVNSNPAVTCMALPQSTTQSYSSPLPAAAGLHSGSPISQQQPQQQQPNQQQRKSNSGTKSSTSSLGLLTPSPSRPRGRPPNSSRSSIGTSKTQPRVSLPKLTPQQLSNLMSPSLSTSAVPYYPLPTLFPDPNLITAAVQSKIPAMLDQQVAAFNLMNLQAQIGGYQAEFLRHFVASSGSMTSPLLPPMPSPQLPVPTPRGRPPSSTYSTNKSPASSQANAAQPTPTSLPQQISSLPQQISSTALPPSISITPLPTAHMQTPVGSNPESMPPVSPAKQGSTSLKKEKTSPSLQQKLQASQALAKSSSMASSSSPSTSPQSKTNSHKSLSNLSSLLTVATSSPHPSTKDSKSFSPQSSKSSPNSLPYTSLIKGSESMLNPAVSISQVVATSTTPKPQTSKLLNLRKHPSPPLHSSHIPPEYSNTSSAQLEMTHARPSSGSHSPGNASVPMPRTESSERSTAVNGKGSTSLLKTKSPDNTYKTQAAAKASVIRTAPSTAETLRNIGHQITVTPSLPQATATTTSLPVFNRVQQSELEIITKPKTSPLDLGLTIPSSITITPKQQSAVSISQVAATGDAKPQNRSSPVAENPRGNVKKFKDSVSITELSRKPLPASSPPKKPVTNNGSKPDDKQGGSGGMDVEIITLE